MLYAKSLITLWAKSTQRLKQDQSYRNTVILEISDYVWLKDNNICLCKEEVFPLNAKNVLETIGIYN
jgi:hypothetical protein